MIEMWGGLECSVVRVHSRYRDEIVETGHADRPEDLESIAALGIATLRYPVLWESVSPRSPDICDWSWHDERLERIRSLGIRPIVGLIHHGSGPHYTSLLDPDFPSLFAAHARRVAERYSWVDLYTPVNEPLTTARFAGLYGHWYPHRRCEADFLRMVMNQCSATLLVIRAIRAITPRAAFIQTEDIGKTFSTPAMAEQAGYENERRWLSLDLLYGRVDSSHPWFARLLAQGVSPLELEGFLGAEARPDIIGVNHYLTSERYLDENVSSYPRTLRGGNGRRRYADTEAVRIPHLAGLTGPKERLREVWERYGLPLAATEVHHGSSRDDQLRWLAEFWQAASELRDVGIPIRAVTAWSLFGAIDWNSLLLRRADQYEPGAFDIRAPSPRLTALGKAVRDLAATGRFSHPVLSSPGWWRRPERFYAPVSAPVVSSRGGGAPVVVLREGGADVASISQICAGRGLTPIVCRAAALPSALTSAGAWAVIDASGLALTTSGRAMHGALPEGARIAALCASAGVPLLSFAVECATAGSADEEDEAVRPTDGSAAERILHTLAAHPAALVVQAGFVFGIPDRSDEAEQVLAALAAGAEIFPGGDGAVSSAYWPDLIHAALDLLVDGERGVWRLAHGGATSWADFARRLASAADRPIPAPAIDALPSRRRAAAPGGQVGPMPDLDDAIARYVASGWYRPSPPRLAAE